MNVFALLALCSFISYTIIGFFVIHLNSKRLINRLFLSISICAAVYSFAEFGYLQTQSYETAQLWLKVRAIWFFTFAFAVYFAFFYAEKGHLMRSLWQKALIFLPASVLFFADVFTDRVTGVPIMISGIFTYDPPEDSWLYHASSIYALACMFLMFGLATHFYFTTKEPIKKRQATFLLLALVMLILAVIINTFIVKITGFEHVHLDSVLMLASNIIFAYSIWRYQFLNITPELAAPKMIEVMSNFVILINPNGKISLINDAASHITGYHKEELVGRLPTVIFDPAEEMGKTETYQALINETLIIKNKNGSLISKSGSRIPILYSVSTVPLLGGRETGLVCVGSELTEIKRAEMKLTQYAFDLKKSNQNLTEIFYTISHDLSESIRLVRTFTQLLGKKIQQLDDKDYEKYMKVLTTESGLIYEKIKGLVTYSELKWAEELEKVDFHEIVQATLARLEDVIQASHAEIQVGNLPALKADKEQIICVLVNLVENAIKFQNGKKPHIHINAMENEKGGWTFSVRDNGIGIDPEYHKKVFALFQRLNERDKYPGIGLGLPLCKKIIEQYNGKIWVESQLGKGSAFYFTLPDN